MHTRFDKNDLADDLLCPITLEIFDNPVSVSPCGHSFEKEAISNWIASHSTCPTCNTQINRQLLIPNISLKKIIYQLLTNHPDELFSPHFIHRIIKEGEVDLLLKILKSRPEKLNEALIENQTALHFAVKEGKLAIIEALINNFKTLDINANFSHAHATNAGFTPIHLASIYSSNASSDIIAYLLAHDADPSISTANHQTPLFTAIWNAKWDHVKLLLDSGKELNINQSLLINIHKGYTALIAAVHKNCPIEIFTKLLSIPGIDVNKKNDHGESALFIAAQKGDHAKVAALLAQHNIDIDARRLPGDGKTALEVSDDISVVELLTTPFSKFLSVKSKLKENDIDSAATLFSEIYHDNSPDILTYLKEINKTYQPVYIPFCRMLLPKILKRAIDQDDNDFILGLLQEVPDLLNELLIEGKSVLHRACAKGKFELVQALFETFKNQVNINALSHLPETKEATALFYAAAHQHKNSALIVAYLLAHGADPAIPTSDGKTPLLAALIPLNKACLQALLDSKKDLNINQTSMNYAEETPLMRAVRHGDTETFLRILSIDNKINVNQRNTLGETALFIAASTGDKAKIKLLLSHPDINLEITTNDGSTIEKNAEDYGHHSVAVMLHCYRLLLCVLKDQPKNVKFKLDYFKQIDEKTLDELFTCLEKHHYNKQIIDNLSAFLKRLRKENGITNANTHDENRFFKQAASQVDEVKILNQLFAIAHQSYYGNKFDWEYSIRQNAFKDLEACDNFSSHQSLNFLKWARTQTIFGKNRHLLSIRPPRTARKIQDMINKIEHPKPK